MSKAKKVEAKAAKSTFWNELRVKNNYMYKDLADTLGTSVGTVGSWFSGRGVPPEKHLKNICDLFGVDYEKGRQEFLEASKVWSSDRGSITYVPELPETSLTESMQKKKDELWEALSAEDVPETITIDFTDDDTASVDVPTPEPVNEGKLDSSDTILRYFYDKLDFDDFVKLQQSLEGNGDPLAVIYRKVDFDDFIAISRQLSQG